MSRETCTSSNAPSSIYVILFPLSCMYCADTLTNALDGKCVTLIPLSPLNKCIKSSQFYRNDNRQNANRFQIQYKEQRTNNALIVALETHKTAKHVQKYKY